jgi:uncharacterized tellurite resistance protein B-like protein
VDLAADAIREGGGGRRRAEEMAKGLPGRGHRLAAYAMACEVCVSDADLPEPEINYLDQLQRAFALTDEEARELFEAARARSGLKTVEEKTATMRALMPRLVDGMALMAAVDGQVGAAEVAGVRAVLRGIPDMAVLSRDELEGALFASFERAGQAEDPAQVLDAIADAIRDPADRYWATVYMMMVARADGVADWREEELLEEVQVRFELSDARMDQAMETASAFPAVDPGAGAPG